MTGHLLLAAAVASVQPTLEELRRRLESADTTHPTVDDARLLLISAELLVLLGRIDDEANRVLSWLPPGQPRRSEA